MYLALTFALFVYLAFIFDLFVLYLVLFFIFRKKKSTFQKKSQTTTNSQEPKEHIYINCGDRPNPIETNFGPDKESDLGVYIQEQKATLSKDKNGHYVYDRKEPYGSVKNPMVVGMPEYSDVLIYDSHNKRWILTDGLGNGYIR